MNPTGVVTIKKGDTDPLFEATVTDNGYAVDLSAATSVRILTRRYGGTTYKTNAVMTIVSAVAGTVSYQWLPADVDTAARYELTFEVLWNSGRKRTFPKPGFIPMLVEDKPATS